ncbi:hypothetical protein [Herbiconiux liangxiaofengii]|uniref:hypothetical protein n=1 Tax=Herbiconiux liangxiaofengii TaxID=3342795 RepID=UPI0035BA54F4
MGEITPEYEAVMADLRAVRGVGIGRLRKIQTPALDQIARLTDAVSKDELLEPTSVRALLRTAVAELGGGSVQEAGEYLLGLYPGTQLWSSKMRREDAAKLFGTEYETFRKAPETELLGMIADAVLDQKRTAALREARVEIEARRHPADSRLAVQWVERFEAYNRMWTPAWALAADLEAALATYLEKPAPHPPWDPTLDQPFDPIEQAQMYARSALYRLAHFELELKRFMSRYGGMWLLSDAEREVEISDVVYKITWHNNLTSEDESFLRRLLADSRHEEADHFIATLLSLSQGRRIEKKWQYLVRQAVGQSEEEKDLDQVRQTIAACHRYCELVDQEWLKIADWYRPGTSLTRGVDATVLYTGHIRGVQDVARAGRRSDRSEEQSGR